MAADIKAEVKIDPKQKSTPSTVDQWSPVAPQALPRVMKLEKVRTSRTKRYSRGTKDFQRLALGLSKAAYRSTNSVAKALRTFADDSNRSARRRRDGIIRDALRNASNAFSDGVTELGKAPGEVARRVSSRRVWRTVRPFIPFTR
jgi:hypothetical protein